MQFLSRVPLLEPVQKCVVDRNQGTYRIGSCLRVPDHRLLHSSVDVPQLHEHVRLPIRWYMPIGRMLMENLNGHYSLIFLLRRRQHSALMAKVADEVGP